MRVMREDTASVSGAGGMTVLAFDYGSKRIGVAVGNTTTRTASALEVLVGNPPDWRRIGALIAEWRPARLVVGHPLDMEGASQPATRGAERFARSLGGRFGLPVERVDERLSTREAWLRRTDSGDRRAVRKGIDALAAQVILETWLGELR